MYWTDQSECSRFYIVCVLTALVPDPEVKSSPCILDVDMFHLLVSVCARAHTHTHTHTNTHSTGDSAAFKAGRHQMLSSIKALLANGDTVDPPQTLISLQITRLSLPTMHQGTAPRVHVSCIASRLMGGFSRIVIICMIIGLEPSVDTAP